MKAAIYARFSTDLQHERSIDDQVALCRAYAEKNGLQVETVYSDRARSGASIFGRDGLLAMMDAARDGRFAVVVVEALDRLSRDQEDLPGLWKRLTFLGVEIRAVHEGRADAVQIGVRGLVGALYLQDLAHKVRRGLAGVVRDGRHAGGRAYGYRAVPGRPGELEIVEEEAAVIRRIYADYVGGATPREITAALNRERVAPPRGTTWVASALNGSRQRGSGILANELYAGRIVWNKVRMVKDPDTGRRVSRVNPPDEWQAVDAPQLAIVDADLVAAARARKAGRGGERPQDRRRPKHLLSGLLRCGCCGGGMSVKDGRGEKARVQCTRRKEGGTCTNGRAYPLATIERIVLAGLRANLEDPALIAAYAEEYNAERQRLAAGLIKGRASVEKRLASVKRRMDRLIDSYADGAFEKDELKERLAPLRTERVQLEEQLAGAEQPPDIVTLHPAAIARYRDQVADLQTALQVGTPAGEEHRAAFRALIESVVVAAMPGRKFEIEVRGHLAQLTGHDLFPQARIRGGMVVAEEGLEPPTRGL